MSAACAVPIPSRFASMIGLAETGIEPSVQAISRPMAANAIRITLKKNHCTFPRIQTDHRELSRSKSDGDAVVETSIPAAFFQKHGVKKTRDVRNCVHDPHSTHSPPCCRCWCWCLSAGTRSTGCRRTWGSGRSHPLSQPGRNTWPTVWGAPCPQPAKFHKIKSF